MKCEKGKKMKILELKNKVPEVKNSQNGFNRKMNSTEERISKLEDRLIKTTQTTVHREKQEKSYSDLISTLKMYISKVLEGE